MRVKLQPASATDLPAHNPILPPAAITQVMLIARRPQVGCSTIFTNEVVYLSVYLCIYLFIASCDSENWYCFQHVCLSVWCVNKPKSGSGDVLQCGPPCRLSGCGHLAEVVSSAELTESRWHDMM